ncbi:NUDIX hydrolase [Ochrovirga pacifica]|uniref:NUDIX hydrolase n=1 Tax=Ochrovirga pacifica TaxID=1042376 RepID=UPI00135F14C4|nr:NUDIX domain-containing protein [Ochrovirga pacifica]
MYKVFFDENLIELTNDNTPWMGYQTEKFSTLDLQFFLSELKSSHETKIQVICENLSNDWHRFIQNFEVRKAAGGVVVNSNEEMLWIFRNNVWDLPKGHIENEETKEIAAIREVEEECGAKELYIKEELETTYHVFQLKDKNILKITYWFLMGTDLKEQKMTPQIEEGITKVVFKSLEESKKSMQMSYKNIQLLLANVLM